MANNKSSERYFAAKEAAEKEAATYDKKIELVIEETEQEAPAVRTPEQSEQEYRDLMTSAQAPAWARPADNAPVVTDGVALDGTVAQKDIESVDAYNAAVKALDEARVKSVEELELAHKRRLQQLHTARRSLELEEERERDKAAAGRLKEVRA